MADNELDRSVVITTPLKPEGHYTFKVWAKNGGLAGPSRQVDAYVPMRRPDNVTAIAKIWGTGPGVELAWKDNSINEDCFQIERTNPDGTKVLIKETLGDGWWPDEGLKYFSKYTYRIRAVSTNTAYNSEWSAPVTVTTSKMPLKYISSMYPKPMKPSYAIASGTLADLLATAAEAAAQEPDPDNQQTDPNSQPDPNTQPDPNAQPDPNTQPDPNAQPDPVDPSAAQSNTLRFYVGETEFYVNDIQGNMDTVPIIQHSRTLLPVRYAAEPLGAVPEWNPEEQKVTITLGGKVLELWIGNNTARINGVSIPIDAENPNVKPIIVSGRTMVPLCFIGEALGCEVQWKQELQEATLIKAQ